jgi:hypothetical protein
MTPTISFTPTESMTFSVSPTYSETPTISETSTTSATPTASPTASASPTITETSTATASPTISPTPSATLTADDSGPCDVIKGLALPNPSRPGLGLRFYFNLRHEADSVTAKVYGPDYKVAAAFSFKGPFLQGWQSAALDPGGLARGLYYVKLTAMRGGSVGGASIFKWYNLGH